MAATYISVKGTRKYLLYVSGTQEQADKHVAAIASLMERIGVERSLNKYGHSKGWRRNQLRCANGFTVEALGLDTAARGAKIDERRPDLEIFDDIDDVDDSPATVEKRERSLKSKIIAAGSIDCAVAFVQNLVHEGGIVFKLASEKADFLLDRVISPIEVAVEGLEVQSADRGDGRKIWQIVNGKATWEGQPLEICEAQINEWGLKTFLREAQQEVEGADGYFFDHKAFQTLLFPERWDGWRFCLASDLASTQGGGDFTVFVLMARDPLGRIWIIDVWRRQLSSERVRRLLNILAVWARRTYGNLTVRLPQDPGQAGKDQTGQLKTMLLGEGFKKEEIKVVPVTGSKSTRASGYAESVNLGNVILAPEAMHHRVAMLTDLGGDDGSSWHHPWKEEHRKFRADEGHEFDDQVDAGADGFNELDKGKKRIRAV